MADTDILYVEDDFVASGYVETTRVTSALLSPYIDDQEAYVDLDYVRNQSGEFTLLADTSAVQHEADATLSASFVQSSSAGRIADYDADLADITTLISTAGVISTADALLQTTATVSADATKPVRPTDIRVYNGTRYNTFEINTSNKKFGAGSLYTEITASPIYPKTKVIWTGSVFAALGHSDDSNTVIYIWTSSDGETWTRATTDLSGIQLEHITKIFDYANGNYILCDDDTIYYSSNGTSWSSVQPGGNGATIDDFVFYDSKYVVTTQTGGNTAKVSDSSDLVNWNQRFSESISNRSGILRLANSSNRIVLVVQNSDADLIVYYGTTPSTMSSSTHTIVSNSTTLNSDGAQIVFNGSTFVIAVGNTSNQIEFYESASGTTLNSWTNTTIGAPTGNYQTLEYIGGNYLLETSAKQYYSTSYSTVLNNTVNIPIQSQEFDFTRLAYDGSNFVVFERNTAESYVSTSIAYSAYDRFEIADCENLYPFAYITREDNSDITQWSSIDFWFYPNADSQSLIMRIGDNNAGDTSANFTFSTQSTTDRLFFSTDNGFGATPSGTLIENSWNHIRTVADGTDVSVYLNGAREATFADTISSQTFGIRIGDIISNAGWYMDELLISDRLLNDPSDTTITVPTQEWDNDVDNQDLTIDLLMHFNDGFTDDNDAPVIISADLASATSVTCDIEVFLGTEVDLSAVSTLTASVGSTISTSAAIASEFTQTADATATLTVDSTLATSATLDATALRTRTTDSSLDTSATLAGSAGVVTQGDSAILCEFTATATAGVTRSADATTASAFTTTADVGNIKLFDTDLDAIATTLTAAAKVGDTLSDLDSVFTTTATASTSSEATATIASAFATTATAQQIKGTTAITSSAFATTTVNTRTRSTTASTASEFTTTATAGRIELGVATLDSAFATQSTAIKQVESNSTAFSEFTVTADATTAKLFDAAITAQASTQITGIATKAAVGDLDAIATTLTAAAKVGDYLVDATVNSTVTADAVKFVGDVPVEIGATTAITADIAAIKRSTSTIDAITTASAAPIVVFEVDASITGNFAITAKSSALAMSTLNPLVNSAVAVVANSLSI